MDGWCRGEENYQFLDEKLTCLRSSTQANTIITIITITIITITGTTAAAVAVVRPGAVC